MPLQVAPPATLPPQGSAPAPAPAPVVTRVFGAESGLIFNAIKPASVKDFEMLLGRLREALAQSSDPVRRQQAEGWKIFKAAEPGPGASVLYVFVVNPAVKGADYGVARILAEAYPKEAQELYRLYTACFASGQTILNLEPR